MASLSGLSDLANSSCSTWGTSSRPQTAACITAPFLLCNAMQLQWTRDLPTDCRVSLTILCCAGATSASAAAAAQGTSGGGGGGGGVSSHALLGMIIAAAVVLAATLGTTAFVVVHFYRAKVGHNACFG